MITPTLKLIENRVVGQDPYIAISKADAFKLIEILAQSLAYYTLLECNGVTRIALKLGEETKELRLEVRP